VNAITLFLSQIDQAGSVPPQPIPTNKPAGQHKLGADGFGGVIKVYHDAKATSGFFGTRLPQFCRLRWIAHRLLERDGTN
jgi:hypothetical protein